MIVDSITIIFLFGLLGVAANASAWKKGFYILPSYPTPPLRFKHVASVFAIYLGATFFLSHYLYLLLQRLSSSSGGASPSLALIFSTQFFLIFTLAIALIAYCRTQASKIFSAVVKNRASFSSRLFDWGLGFASWLLAFPIVVAIGQLCDLLLYLIWGVENYEQVAVRYLKTSLQSLPLQAMALISIIIIAPIIEEFLFRGTLQTYLKKHFNAKAAIFITSACFAFFHYSPEQGLGNLSLLPSLFTLASFLGFVYERQGSLYASIGLHMAFNLINTIRILLISEG